MPHNPQTFVSAPSCKIVVVLRTQCHRFKIPAAAIPKSIKPLINSIPDRRQHRRISRLDSISNPPTVSFLQSRHLDRESAVSISRFEAHRISISTWVLVRLIWIGFDIFRFDKLDSTMVDCRSLIEFCRAFEQHRNRLKPQSSPDNRRSVKKMKSLNPLSHPFCDHSPFAAIDTVLLFLVLGALAVLMIPYFKFIFNEAAELLPVAMEVMAEVVYHARVEYFVGLILMLVTAIAMWEVINHQFRKCGNPYCKGLRKAVEFDIQLESEECLKYLPPMPKDAFGARPLELGEDHKELEAELKKMAPLNGRTVLIFRVPCGCPAGRMEVWGAKKVRRIKK